jgi:hypothetical protein
MQTTKNTKFGVFEINMRDIKKQGDGINIVSNLKKELLPQSYST